ncbi:hypothetical protein PS903_04471 [Pseudomonas fluorescens]|nr:hypothetical protein PS903_04471 [Pseudomonas fluorescens]
MPANRATRFICCTALSFFACRSQACRRTGQRGLSVVPRYRSSQASLAPTGEPGNAVYLLHRVIVLRGQASLLQANRPPRFICCTALSFFAGKPRSYRRTGQRGLSVAPRHRSSRASLAPTGEPATAVYLLYRVIVLRRQASLLQANRATRFICCTASSFFAGKPRSYRRTGQRGLSVAPRHRSSRASLAPTGEPGTAQVSDSPPVGCSTRHRRAGPVRKRCRRGCTSSPRSGCRPCRSSRGWHHFRVC